MCVCEKERVFSFPSPIVVFTQAAFLTMTICIGGPWQKPQSEWMCYIFAFLPRAITTIYLLSTRHGSRFTSHKRLIPLAKKHTPARTCNLFSATVRKLQREQYHGRKTIFLIFPDFLQRTKCPCRQRWHACVSGKQRKL